MRRAFLALPAMALWLASPACAQQAPAVPASEAFSQPTASLNNTEMDLFRAGRALFHQPWVVGPSVDHPEVQGLGPLYNRLSCVACHIKNGAGVRPEEGEPLRTAIVRFSVPGHDPHGAPVPDPVYGGQLNPQGIPGVDGEGDASFSFETETVTLKDGERVELRHPVLHLTHLAYGPLSEDVAISVRNAPAVIGLGLLEQVPDEELRAIAAENGGRLNTVWDIEHNAFAVGRFGLKANQPSVKQQTANAFVEDIGITNSLFPAETCTPAETICYGLINKKATDATGLQLAAVSEYVSQLAVPPRRDAQSAEVRRGEALFGELGCAACHRDTLKTASGEDIHPYTDLLLHDMGDGLADGRTDYQAGPRDWRTAPLWGIGLAGKMSEAASYLHDGRARSFAEAVLWHGGEAQAAADRFRDLARDDRAALIAFLTSL